MLLESRPAAGALLGALTPPGDKSMSHRALILGALAAGESRIEGLLDSEDVRATTAALRQLGVEVLVEGTQVRITGREAEGFNPPTQALDMGNSGTAMRLLAGVLAAQPFTSCLVGDASLSRRPMRRIIEPLRAMGADISATAEGHAPLTIVGRSLHGVDYASPVASAQVKSCVLLAGLFAKGRTRVREPWPSRDHTERMLGLFGAPLDAQGWLEGGARLRGIRFSVPADVSSAAFPLAAAVLTPGSDILLRNVGLNATRTGLLEAVRAMGGALEIKVTASPDSEPVGDIRVRYSGRLRAIDISGEQIPGMVDEIPVLMALAATADGVTRIRGAAELRLKESDRLAVMGDALRALGVGIQLYADGADIEGRDDFCDVAELDSGGDHRCAMSLAVLGTRTGAGLRIRQAQYIATSYPDFVRQMCSLGADLRLEDKA